MDLADYRNIVVLTGAGISQSALTQARGDGFVEPRHDEREPQVAGLGKRRAGVPGRLGVAHDYFPVNSALRFWRNACVPSRMSSVLATRPKSVASKTCASASVIWSPLLTASMM